MGRSFKSWSTTILDLFGVESYLEKTAFSARTKSVMKDFYHAARNGFSEKDCAITYSKCPVAVAVEPLRNSVFSKIIGRPQHPMHVPRPQPQPFPMLYSVGPPPPKYNVGNSDVESKTGQISHHHVAQPSINGANVGHVGNGATSHVAPQSQQSSSQQMTSPALMEPVEIKKQSQPIQYHPSVNVPTGHHHRLH